MFGQTCDGADIIANNLMMPEMKVGDWIVFGGMGNPYLSQVRTQSAPPANSTEWSLFLKLLCGTKKHKCKRI